eukprot:scaffold83_cov246-Pinguiococcus_pyrenoidosus.AAC.19
MEGGLQGVGQERSAFYHLPSSSYVQMYVCVHPCTQVDTHNNGTHLHVLFLLRSKGSAPSLDLARVPSAHVEHLRRCSLFSTCAFPCAPSAGGRCVSCWREHCAALCDDEATLAR